MTKRGKYRRQYASGLALALLMILAGCAGQPRLTPAPAARTPQTDGKNTALAQDSGVRITANGSAWNTRPHNLPQAITPVRVSIENNSGKPVRIRYEDFTLTTASRYTSHALPPLRIRGSVPSEPVPIVEPGFVYGGFGLAPYYSPFYPGFGLWGGPFAYSWPYYATAYAQWPISLPTTEMLSSAVPEGVLNDEGIISGFLYFPRVPKDADGVRFDFLLVNADTGDSFGTISIPFEYKE